MICGLDSDDFNGRGLGNAGGGGAYTPPPPTLALFRGSGLYTGDGFLGGNR